MAIGLGVSLPLQASELSAAQATRLLQQATEAAARGKPHQAERIWQELLPWVRRHAPQGSAMLPQSLLQLGSAQHDLGQLPQAEASYREALAAARNLDPPRPTLVAALLNNQAGLNADLERFAEARALLEESLQIKTAALGPDHLEVGIGLSNLGDLLRDLGDTSAAEELFRTSLRVLTPLSTEHPLALAATLNNLSRLQQQRGDWKGARASLEHAQDLRLRVLSPPHPDLGLGLNNLGMLALSQGDLGQARQDLEQALAQTRVLGGSPADQAQQIANLARVDAASGFLAKSIESLTRAQMIFDRHLGTDHPSSLLNLAELLLAHHRVDDNQNRIPLLRRLLQGRFALLSGEAQRLKPRERLLLLRRRDPSWFLADIQAQENQEAANLALAQRLNTQGLLQELQRHQQVWLRSSGSEPSTQPNVVRSWVEPSEVAAVLPAGSVLIEFKRYLDPARIPQDSKTPLPWRYQAYALRPDASVKVVELVSASELEPRIRRAYVATAEQLNDAEELWQEVAVALMSPLRRAIPEAKDWFLVPDAGLHQVPYQALAPDRRIRLLTTGRDLLRLQQEGTNAAGPPVIAGNPAIVNNLPVTASEVNGIARMLGVSPVTGKAFSRTALENLSSPRILHLASHGYWDEEEPPVEKTGSPARELDPMLRSGIELSNNRSNIGRSDRFSAANFLTLNLSATELVTLSACSTGLGDLHDSEGIYGLQRGVQVAGARSVLTSLWPVDDAATGDWMLRYYKYLSEGISRSDAVLAVQKDFREHPNTDWRHPYYWAGWQLVGDWRVIEGL